MNCASEELTTGTVAGYNTDEYVELLFDGDQSRTSQNGMQVSGSGTNKHQVVIAVNLSKNWTLPFDFTALQDTNCKFFHSVQWLAGNVNNSNGRRRRKEKIFLPIIEINTSRASEANEIVYKLAAGEIIIPKISILPTKLSCRIILDKKSHSTGKETYDLVLQFQLQKTSPNPEQWANWGLQFLHNQLYLSFAAMGAQAKNHPFQVTLARGIVWKSDEHMREFFTQSERILQSWSQRGQVNLTSSSVPSLSKELYLLRNGVATNYFPCNLPPPYTSKFSRCLISNVMEKTPVVGAEENHAIPRLASFMVNGVVSGLKSIARSAASPSAAVATAKLESGGGFLSASSLFIAHSSSKEDIEDFNYELFLKVKNKKVNVEGFAQEQAKDFDLNSDLQRHPKKLLKKQIFGHSLILVKGIDDKYRIAVPESLKKDLLILHHDCLVNPTAESNFDTVIYSIFTWNGIHEDAKQYVETEKALQDSAKREMSCAVNVLQSQSTESTQCENIPRQSCSSDCLIDDKPKWTTLLKSALKLKWLNRVAPLH